MADLSGVLAKLDRADHHRQELQRRFAEFLSDHPYGIAHDFYAESGWNKFRWIIHKEPPLHELALILGDFLTNLRATLDYLAWQLVLANENTPTDRIMFPASKVPDDWASIRSDRLKGVDDYWAGRIEELQPYHRKDRPELHPLAILDHVNNVNKHRALPPVITSAEHWKARLNLSGKGGRYEHHSFTGEPMEHGADLFHVRGIDTRERIEMNVKGAMLFRVAFRDGLGYRWDNDEIFEWVTDAVAIFKPAFAS